MASSLFAEDLTCSICLSIFRDPVTLQCGHAFCRQCAGEALAVRPQCPQCCVAVGGGGTEAHDLPSSFILKSLAEKARGAQSPQAPRVQEVDLCPEHEEKLKLFCFTDQQLACIICRDSERHEGHKFKPIKEGEAVLREELGVFVQKVSSDIRAVEALAHTQREEISKSREKSEHLTTQISNQFTEMHDFLRRREREIKDELKQKQEDDMKRMSENLSIVEAALSESRELQAKANSTLTITNPEKFLKTWTEDNNRKTIGVLLRPRANELRVENTSFSLGPYESHLQFFVWKEMLEVIHPRAERLSLTSNSPDVIITNIRRSLIGQQSQFKNTHKTLWPLPTTSGQALSSTKFSTGEHYWEVDVGSRDLWSLGLNHHFLQFNGQHYSVCCPNKTRAVTLANRLLKIGLYLNCSSRQLSFYDAESLAHIDTVDLNLDSLPASAYFCIKHSGPDNDPLTVCWY